MTRFKLFTCAACVAAALLFSAPAGAQSARPAAAQAETPAEKAKREALEKENARISAENQKITAVNETVARTFKAGNDALAAGRLDEAVAQYREGHAARPDEPAMLTNLAEALRLRGASRFNDSLKNKDERARAAAAGDWKEAAEAARKAIGALKATPPPSDPAAQARYAQNLRAAHGAWARVLRLVATKVDKSQARAALEAYRELIAVTPDPARKSALGGESASMLFEAEAYDEAVAEGRKVLAADPNNAAACRAVGLSLLASGDTAKYQEAADLLQRYLDLAPADDQLRRDAVESLNYLKSAEGVTPRKR